MTVEQVLIYLLAAIAGIFLFLGLAQALDDRPPRPRRRRGRPTEEPDAEWPDTETSAEEGAAVPTWARRGRVEAPPGLPAPAIEPVASVEPGPIVEPAPELETTRAVEIAPTAEAEARVAETRAYGSPDLAPVPVSAIAETVVQAHQPPPAAVIVDGEPVPHGDSVTPPSATPPARMMPLPPARSGTAPDLIMVEDAMSLCLAGRHQDVLARIEPRLAAAGEAGGAGPRSHVMTALHCLAGLARHATGEAAAARASFEAAVRALPEPGSEPCPPRVAALSVPLARRLLEGVGDPSGEGDGRAGEIVDAARLAAFWSSWRLHAAPGDEDTLALLGSAREVMAESLNEVIVASIRRHEYETARAIVERAVDTGELPSARGEVLLELLGVTFRQEIDRLTAAAMRAGKDEGLAVSGLGQAEALLAAMPEGAISPAHRAAVAQRIWRGHSKLGFRRLHLGQLDAAADTLFHALGMREIGRRRQRQVRDALVRVLEGLGDQGGSAVGALLADGRRPEAVEAIDRLALRMQRAREHGVSDEELEVAAARLEQLRRRLDESTATA